MSDLIPFHFDAHEIRVQIDAQGQPWWIAQEVCAVLGIHDVSKAIARLKPKERRSESRNLLIINESGLYRLIMRSNKPDAERFQDWVFGEVLPTIRKTGQYAPTLPATTSGDLLVHMAEAYRDQERRLQAIESQQQLTDTKATLAHDNATRAIESQLFYTVAEYIYFAKLQRQVPESAYKACSDHLRLYCLDNAIPFRDMPVGGKQWKTEYAYPQSTYTDAFPGWLKRRYAQTELHVIHTGGA